MGKARLHFKNALSIRGLCVKCTTMQTVFSSLTSTQVMLAVSDNRGWKWTPVSFIQCLQVAHGVFNVKVSFALSNWLRWEKWGHSSASSYSESFLGPLPGYCYDVKLRTMTSQTLLQSQTDFFFNLRGWDEGKLKRFGANWVLFMPFYFQNIEGTISSPVCGHLTTCLPSPLIRVMQLGPCTSIYL